MAFLRNPENLPNILTMSRILAVPLIILLLYSTNRWINLFTAVVFVLAAVTDALDGYLARKHHTVTPLGKLLDPVADKVLVLSAFVMLVHLGRASAWIVCLIICREVAITGLRAIMAEQGIVVAASGWAKYKTIFQIVAVVALTIHYPFLFTVDSQVVGTVFLWLALFLTLWTGYDYFRHAMRYIIGGKTADRESHG
ncbi:MAG: CDP-diacylglycerol--glycerol-3-phosphate 3-phosphatidyltransferase [Deltaproteobacteria bacterium]|nr:CDP-diacylglycerol--glycerol-3-phosphate 3-phosphatidyltransferase [Candidatus Anaeroferrophillacea bacterium]